MSTPYKAAWMTDDLVQFGDAIRRFSTDYLLPNDVAWREHKQATREAWRKAGELGMILPDVPDTYGGADGTPAHAAVVFWELGYSGNTGLGLGLSHIVGHLVAKTDPALGAKGISLFLVDTTTPGFQRGKVLEKLGMEGNDTSEMYFDDCIVPADCLLGEEEGRGFYQLMEQLAYERAQIAIWAVGAMTRAFELTVDYVKDRRAFGKALIEFQNTRFVLAGVKATVTAARAFSDMVVQQWIDGTLDAATASMAKFWCTERQCEVTDQCLQLFGGYGYMKEYPIARLYADARVQRIYGGTNEIQRELVGRQL